MMHAGPTWLEFRIHTFVESKAVAALIRFVGWASLNWSHELVEHISYSLRVVHARKGR
jgi:hypothetical protein